ncbi:PREDICTED: replication [Prunus dulcis]|uniref:PREDICTED: replication n=1 Tax=Prunus dulcis TaxID=3755 RepID=A0A5E4GM90_PRUDU|nr:PREDICTED: replication [Prunus dulcis]
MLPLSGVKENFDSREMQEIEDGMYVRVNGHLKVFRGVRQIVAFSLQGNSATQPESVDSSLSTPVRSGSSGYQTAPSNQFYGQVSVGGIKGCDQLVLDYLQQHSSMEAIRSLEEEGLIYSTIDEFHYKSAAYFDFVLLRFTSPTTSPPTLAFSFFQIWFLHRDIGTSSLSALSRRYRIVYTALAKVLALVLAPILSTSLISILWYIPCLCCDWLLLSSWCTSGLECEAESDSWRNVLVLMCLCFLGKFCSWPKIGGSLCAAMLTCVEDVNPLLCGHIGEVGTVSGPFVATVARF